MCLYRTIDGRVCILGIFLDCTDCLFGAEYVYGFMFVNQAAVGCQIDEASSPFPQHYLLLHVHLELWHVMSVCFFRFFCCRIPGKKPIASGMIREALEKEGNRDDDAPIGASRTSGLGHPHLSLTWPPQCKLIIYSESLISDSHRLFCDGPTK